MQTTYNQHPTTTDNTVNYTQFKSKKYRAMFNPDNNPSPTGGAIALAIPNRTRLLALPLLQAG
jgi:hypothetical protein